MPLDERPARRPPSRRGVPRIPIYDDLLDVSDDMIAFVEKYQEVWAAESKAMLALGEFLGARAEAMRAQADLMRMGSDTFRRYNQWSETLLRLRPDTFLQMLLGDARRRPADTDAEGDEA